MGNMSSKQKNKKKQKKNIKHIIFKTVIEKIGLYFT